MTWLLDASVIIHVFEGHPGLTEAVARLDSVPEISALTRAELENGIDRDPAQSADRRALLNEFLKTVAVQSFDKAAAVEYGRIVAAQGYSRPRTIDRMIAAQAISSRATLITMNGNDFRAIAGLDLAVWTA